MKYISAWTAALILGLVAAAPVELPTLQHGTTLGRRQTTSAKHDDTNLELGVPLVPDAVKPGATVGSDGASGQVGSEAGGYAGAGPSGADAGGYASSGGSGSLSGLLMPGMEPKQPKPAGAVQPKPAGAVPPAPEPRPAAPPANEPRPAVPPPAYEPRPAAPPAYEPRPAAAPPAEMPGMTNGGGGGAGDLIGGPGGPCVGICLNKQQK